MAKRTNDDKIKKEVEKVRYELGEPVVPADSTESFEEIFKLKNKTSFSQDAKNKPAERRGVSLWGQKH